MRDKKFFCSRKKSGQWRLWLRVPVQSGGESGHVLVPAVAVMLAVFILGGAAVGLGRAGARISFEHRDKVKVYYIAEAGVEKVLARARWDAGWLWDLPFNTEVEYLAGLPYGGGTIARVRVKKEGMVPASPGAKEDVISTTIVVTSTGEYRNSRKTLIVKATVGAPLNYRRGIWLKSPSSAFGKGSSILGNIFADGSLGFSHNCSVAGTVTAGGNLSVAGGVSVVADAVAARGSVTLYDNARLDGDVRAPGNVVLNNGSLIGSAATGEYGEIVRWRDIYYNGTLTNSSGRTIDPSKLHPGQAGSLVLPQFPLLDRQAFENVYDFRMEGDQTFHDDPLCLSGIYLVNGDVNISGTYRGVGAIVAMGDVTVEGDLRKRDSGSSLLIVSYGQNGIDIGRNRVVDALFYVPPKVLPETGSRRLVCGDGSRIFGSIICDVLEMGAGSQFTFDGAMADLQPGWFTSAVTVNSWEEEKKVF